MIQNATPSYDQLRKASLEINRQIVRTLEREEISRAAEELGLLSRGTLILSGEDDSNVLMDYAMHRRGSNPSAAGRYCANHGAQLDVVERRWAEASAQARFRILQVHRRLGASQSDVIDLLTGEQLVLADTGVAETASPGNAMAGYVLAFPDFVATSGGGIPMPASTAELLVTMLQAAGYPVGSPDMAKLSAEDQASVAAMVLGMLLRARRAEHDIDDDFELREVDAPLRPSLESRLQRKPARNAPCPCGSGRKYKSCCGRAA